MRQAVCVRLRALEHRYHLSRSFSLLSLVLESFIDLLIYLFSLLRGEMRFASTARPFLVGGGVVIESVIGYHIFYDYSVLFLTMTCNTCSGFQAWENEIV